MQDTFKHNHYQSEPAKNAIHFIMVNYTVSLRHHSPDDLRVETEEKHKIIAGFDTKQEAKDFVSNNYAEIEKDFSQIENFGTYSRKLTFNDIGIMFDREQEIEYLYGEEIDYDRLRQELNEEVEECSVSLMDCVMSKDVDAFSEIKKNHMEMEDNNQTEPDDDFEIDL